MDSLTLGVAIVYALFGLIHWIAAIYFSVWLKKQARNPLEAPKKDGPVAVLVAARGFDPSLAEMLKGLMNQTHNDYEIHLVADDSDGELLQHVQELTAASANSNRLQLHSLGEPLETCGLKNSALLEGLKHVSANAEFLAMIDTDIIPPSDWLVKVVRPLADSNVGVATGGQWFEPSGRFELGTLIRCLWNAAAIVPTALFANAWAGSLALRRSDFERAKIADLWTRTIVDDGPLPEAMRRLGLQMRFVPDLIMVNGESCSLSFVTNYLARMLSWSRLYETSFRNTLGHATITSTLLLLVVFCFIRAAVTGQFAEIGTLVLGIAAGLACYVVAFATVRSAISGSSDWARDRIRAQPVTVWVGLAVLVPVTQALFCISTCRALLLRRISWRNVTYEIRGPEDVRLLANQPAGPNGAGKQARSV